MSATPLVLIGADGRMGRFVQELLHDSSEFALCARLGPEASLGRELASSGALLGLDFTRAGLGFEHGELLLEAGIRPVIGTSGVTPEEVRTLDSMARERSLGGLVVPNFSLGAWLLQQAAERIARQLASCEIIELHHDTKRDAPSATARQTRAGIAAAQGRAAEEIPIHSVRLPSLYAHQSVLLSGAGELVTLRHDMLGPQAFGPGILVALRHARLAQGVQLGIHRALGGAERG